MMKPRKRKNTAPRYNPYQPQNSQKRLDTSSYRSPVSDKIAMLLDADSSRDKSRTDVETNRLSESVELAVNEAINKASDVCVNSVQPATCVAEPGVLDAAASIHSPEHRPTNSITVQSLPSATSVDLQPSINSIVSQALSTNSLVSVQSTSTISPAPPPSIKDSFCSPLSEADKVTGSTDVASERQKVPLPCGPFVTNSQTELLATIPSTDISNQLSSAQFTESMVQEAIELPSFLLGEQGLGADVPIFVDIPQATPPIAHDLSAAPQPKTKKKRTVSFKKKLAGM